MRKYKMKWFFISIIILFTFFIFLIENNSLSKSSVPVKVGVIIFSDLFSDSLRGLKDGIASYGFNNIEFVETNINGDLNKVDQILKSFKEKGIKIIFATTTPLNQKLKELNDKYDFHIIFTQVASPVESGLIKDERISGTNFIGISRAAFRTVPKRMTIFKDAFPDLEEFVIFYGKEEKFLEKHLAKYDNLSKELGIKLTILPIKSGSEIDNYEITNPKITGIFMAPSATTVRYFKNIKQLAEKYRVPIMAIDTYLVKNGATIAYSQSFYDDGFQASYYLNLLIKGLDPKDLAIQLPEKMELFVNKSVINKLSIKFNRNYYGYADKVIE